MTKPDHDFLPSQLLISLHQSSRGRVSMDEGRVNSPRHSTLAASFSSSLDTQYSTLFSYRRLNPPPPKRPAPPAPAPKRSAQPPPPPSEKPPLPLPKRLSDVLPSPPAWLWLKLLNLSSPWLRACCSRSAHDVSPPAFCQLPVVRGCCEVLPSVLELAGVVPVSYFCQPSPVFLYTLPFTSE